MRFLVIILALASFLAGCSSDNSQKEPPAGGETQASTQDQITEIEKWNSYVDLGNNVDADFYKALDAYFEAFGSGPDYKLDAPQDLIDAFVVALPSPLELSRSIDRAMALATKNSQDELDLAVAEVLPHLKTLWNHLTTAKSLYERGKGEEGSSSAAELHNKIYESYQALSITYDRFRGVLGQADAARRKTDLQTMLDQGLVIRPAMLLLLDSAQTLQDYLSSHSITTATLAGLDLAVFEPLFDEFLKDYDLYNQVISDTAQAKAENVPSGLIASFTGQAMVVKEAAQELVERRRNANTVEDGQQLGTPEHFAEVLGELVDLYNSGLNQ